MLITIAIPTYNNEKTIAKAIQSALNQDYDDEYEILVANNASIDKTQEVINSFNDEKIRVVINEKTYDMYTNHNICLKEAKGDYVLFCHSDDELLPNALTVLSERIEERHYPASYILWGHSMFRDFNFSIIEGGQHVNSMFSGEAAVKCFLHGGLTPSGTCYSRQSLLGIGGFPSSTTKAPEMDWVVMVVAAFNCFEFEMLDRIIYKRKDASTAVRGMSNKEKKEIHVDALGRMFERMTEGQVKYFVYELIKRPSPDILDSVKGYISKKTYFIRYVKMLFRRFL